MVKHCVFFIHWLIHVYLLRNETIHEDDGPICKCDEECICLEYRLLLCVILIPQTESVCRPTNSLTGGAQTNPW